MYTFIFNSFNEKGKKTHNPNKIYFLEENGKWKIKLTRKDPNQTQLISDEFQTNQDCSTKPNISLLNTESIKHTKVWIKVLVITKSVQKFKSIVKEKKVKNREYKLEIIPEAFFENIKKIKTFDYLFIDDSYLFTQEELNEQTVLLNPKKIITDIKYFNLEHLIKSLTSVRKQSLRKFRKPNFLEIEENTYSIKFHQVGIYYYNILDLLFYFKVVNEGSHSQKTCNKKEEEFAKYLNLEAFK